MKTIKSLQILFKSSTYRIISLYASCITYYMILSSIPAVISLISIFSNLGITTQIILDILSGSVPNILIDQLRNMILTSQGNSIFSILSLSTVVWIWSASKGIFTLMDGMDAAIRITDQKSYFYNRLISIVQLLILSLGSNIVLLVIVFSKHFLTIIQSVFPVFSSFLLTLFDYRIILSTFLLTLLFSIMFKLHPTTSIAFRFCFLGGLFTALGWTVLSCCFSIYVNHFATKYMLFGELGTLLLLSVWLRICIMLFLIGMKYSYLRSLGQRSVIQYVIKLFRSICE